MLPILVLIVIFIRIFKWQTEQSWKIPKNSKSFEWWKKHEEPSSDQDNCERFSSSGCQKKYKHRKNLTNIKIKDRTPPPPSLFRFIFDLRDTWDEVAFGGKVQGRGLPMDRSSKISIFEFGLC